MSSSIYRAVNTTLIYIECGGEYLMLHRTKKENDCNRDKWIGIGGKFEEGESPEECALRETKEETGLTLTSYRYRGIVTFVSDKWESEYMHLFTADGFEGTLKDCDEGELAWIKKKDLLALPAWEGDKIFLRLLDENVPFFSLRGRNARGGEAQRESVGGAAWISCSCRPAFSARPAATTEKVKRTRACRRWWENMKLFLSAPNSSAVSRRRVCPANGGASVSSQRVAAM